MLIMSFNIFYIFIDLQKWIIEQSWIFDYNMPDVEVLRISANFLANSWSEILTKSSSSFLFYCYFACYLLDSKFIYKSDMNICLQFKCAQGRNFPPPGGGKGFFGGNNRSKLKIKNSGNLFKHTFSLLPAYRNTEHRHKFQQIKGFWPPPYPTI